MQEMQDFVMPMTWRSKVDFPLRAVELNLLSLDNKNKKLLLLFCIVLAYSYLCTQKRARLLPLGNSNQFDCPRLTAALLCN